MSLLNRFRSPCFASLAVGLVLAGSSAPLHAAGDVHADRRVAQLAYDREMESVGKECSDAVTPIDINDCVFKTRDQTSKNFEAFYGALRSVLIDISADDARALALDGAQNTWEKSRQQTCDAVRMTSQDPSKDPSAQARCFTELTRSRMRDLNELYALPLNR